MKHSLISDANRDEILDLSEITEVNTFIDEQIDEPFESNTNHMKFLIKKYKKYNIGKDEINTRCLDILTKIEDTFDGTITFDFDDDTNNLLNKTYSIYRLFIRNIRRNMRIFLLEYLLNNKNRKELVYAYSSNMKIESFPRSQYGDKSNYILIIKLEEIISDIADKNITITEFLKYLDKANDSASYIDAVRDMIDLDNIADSSTLIGNIIDRILDSDISSKLVSDLTEKLYKKLIIPSLDNVDSSSIIEDADDDILTDEDDDDEGDE